ncbi:MAG: helix-turn-helix transcriptional regulator [Caldimonas sp.]
MESITPQVMEPAEVLRYRAAMPHAATLPVGILLRDWRLRRHRSQLDLAADADVSTRHLSFVETGRSVPSREMVLRLANRLDVPLRERNQLLLAAGYAPMYGERGLDDPAMAAARSAVERVLKGHEPYPALAIDRHWTLVSYNRMVPLLLAGTSAALLRPPVNVLRLSLHPEGLAPRIRNLAAWRAHLFERLRQQVASSGDRELAALAEDLRRYPGPIEPSDGQGQNGIVVPLVLGTAHGDLSFLSTTTVFGTPVDITLSELALETFFPADATTSSVLSRMLDESTPAQ